jgi:hypothetical protein
MLRESRDIMFYQNHKLKDRQEGDCRLVLEWKVAHKKDRISRPSDEPGESVQTERRPLRAQTMARREERNRVNPLTRGDRRRSMVARFKNSYIRNDQFSQ